LFILLKKGGRLHFPDARNLLYVSEGYFGVRKSLAIDGTERAFFVDVPAAQVTAWATLATDSCGRTGCPYRKYYG
jgi:hypothetical protein